MKVPIMGSKPGARADGGEAEIFRHELRQKQRGEEDGRGQQGGDSGGEESAVLHDAARTRALSPARRSMTRKPTNAIADSAKRPRMKPRGPAEIQRPVEGEQQGQQPHAQRGGPGVNRGARDLPRRHRTEPQTS